MNSRLLFFKRNAARLPAPEDYFFDDPEPLDLTPEPKPNPIAHPFVALVLTVRSSRTGEIVKAIDPRVWPDYGLKAVR